ncbi:hypothetical protein Q9L58_007411 [Maublancomyces gigas]|uniref:Ankyrin repeat protein n=1 Tax=Discina gigas TaxID=1032678 RepID=A0ABR3GCJ0_9PEZI
MEAAISVIGLLAAGAQISTTLQGLISTYSDAPLLAHTTCNEVRDFKYALSKLQPYIDGSIPIKLLGASMIDTHHLSLTLAASVFTFSRLEKKLDRLILRVEKPEDRAVVRGMDTLSRLRWLRDDADISRLVQNIQQHKSSLNLLLTVLISESLTEAEEGRTRLEEGLAEIIACLSGQTQSALPSQAHPDTQYIPIGAIMKTDTSSMMTINSISSRLSRHAFESILLSSRPYRTITNLSVMSVASSQRRGTRWSLYSGGSNTSVFSLPITCFEPLGQTLATTNVRDIPLPIRTDSLFNPWWYNTKIGSPPGAVPNRALSMVSLGRRSLESALHEAVKAGDTGAVIRLISQGANIEMIDSEGLRPLIWAVRCNNERMVRIFLNEGANVNKEGRSGGPGLNRSLGSRAIARLLLNPGSIGFGDEPPLSCAIRLGHGAITEILLDRAGIEAWDGGRASLHLAVRWGHESNVQIRTMCGVVALCCVVCC